MSKKIKKLLIFSLTISAFFTSAASAAVIEILDYNIAKNAPAVTILDFESGSTGVSSPSNITISGEVAGWHGAGYINYFQANGIQPETFGQQYLGNSSAYPRHTDITVNFSGPVNFVGAWLMMPSNPERINTIRFELFDINNKLISSALLTVPKAFSEIYYFGLLSDVAVSRAIWHPIESSFFRIDNLSYGIMSPVPVPSAFVLFGSALAGLLGIKRITRRSRGQIKAPSLLSNS